MWESTDTCPFGDPAGSFFSFAVTTGVPAMPTVLHTVFGKVRPILNLVSMSVDYPGLVALLL